MKRFVLLLLLAAAAPAFAAAPVRTWTLTRAQWGGVGEARQVIAIAPIGAAVRALERHPGARLAVVHNGGEEGVFWAADLEGWLVALGVPSARIVDRAGAVPPGRLRLELAPGHAAGP